MDKRAATKATAYVRIAFGLLILAAFVTQMVHSLRTGRSLVNFFSFFTIESNLMAAAILLVLGSRVLSGAKIGHRLAYVRGAVTLYMTITGMVFALLLSGLTQRLQTTIPWVNTVFHYLMPAVLLVDWLVLPPLYVLRLRQALVWLVFPVVYLCYTLIRGPIAHWYPYPFLDPSDGWFQVIAACASIAAGALLLTWLLVLRTQYRKSTHG
jgi:hypothetical protein